MSVRHSSSTDEELRQEVDDLVNQLDGENYVELTDVNHHKARIYGLALQNNETVSELFISDDMGADEGQPFIWRYDAFPLEEFARNSRSLKRFHCLKMRNERFVRNLLDAAAANPNIEEVFIGGIPVMGEMIQTLLDRSQSMQYLTVEGDRSSERATELSFEVDLKDAFKNNNTIKHLYLDKLKFRGMTIHFLSEAIKQSASIQELQFTSCEFDAISTQLFSDFLCGEQSNAPWVYIHCLEFENETSSSFLKNLITTKAPTLRLQMFYEESYFRELLSALARHASSETALDCLTLYGVTLKGFKMLESSLPTICGLKQLRLTGDMSVEIQRMKPCLVKALRKNHCLHCMNITSGFHYEEIEHYEIDSYCERNNTVQKWEDFSMPEQYLYRVLAISQQYEFRYTIVFELLKNNWSP